MAFYGIETYGWEDMDTFVQYAFHNPEKALNIGAEYFKGPDYKYLTWTNNNWHSTFFAFVLKFLAKFYNIDFEDLINKKYPDLLNSYIWGNANSIERFEVFAKKANASKDAFEIVKRESKVFDSLDPIIDALKPDVIFILSKKVDENFINDKNFIDSEADIKDLYNIDVENKGNVLKFEPYEEDKISFKYYYLRNTMTHIFCLPHPTWMGVYSGKHIEDFVDKMIQAIKDYSIWKELPTVPKDWFLSVKSMNMNTIDAKYLIIAQLAQTLMSTHTLMSGKQLADILNLNKIKTQNGSPYSDNGGRGIHKLISNAWKYYYDRKKFQTAYNISRSFVNQNGDYAW